MPFNICEGDFQRRNEKLYGLTCGSYNATEMLKQFGGENVAQGRVIEVHIGTLTTDQAFTFTDE